MMAKKYLLLPVIALLIISCEKIELKAPYQEIPVLYCLINAKDSVQYVRINRLYYCDDAYAFMQCKDSISYPFGAWEVILEQRINDVLQAEPVIFEPTYGIIKDEGQFANGNHVIYRTDTPLLTNCDYVLR